MNSVIPPVSNNIIARFLFHFESENRVIMIVIKPAGIVTNAMIRAGFKIVSKMFMTV